MKKFEVGKEYRCAALYGGEYVIKVVDRTETTISYIYSEQTSDDRSVQIAEIKVQSCKVYELKPEPLEFNVKFNVTNEQVGRIHKLFVKWCKYVAEDGTQPFVDYTVEKFFEVMMQVGSFHDINRHIENMEYEQEIK